MLTGKVVSIKMQKTVVVEVKSQHRHPIYKKIVRRSSRFKVHNENPNVHIGDIVQLTQTRPISKSKRWRVVV